MMSDAFEFRTLGFVGLGAMGKPMLMHLANKLPEESRIYVFDLEEKLVDEVSANFPNKVFKGSSAKEVAQQVVSSAHIRCKADSTNVVQETIITIVPEGSHVRSVYLDPDAGICAADMSNKLLIDCSTIDTATSLAVKDHIAAKFPSACFYDAPVSGGVVGAIKGTIAFFLGCAETDPNIRRFTHLTSLMGNQIIPCGGPSLGLAAKLSNNYLSGVIAIACSEACE
jgi:3-hydroxyisobutyrate dehydrogenase-like beta-hydroxyacid dehydrogenase